MPAPAPDASYHTFLTRVDECIRAGHMADDPEMRSLTQFLHDCDALATKLKGKVAECLQEGYSPVPAPTPPDGRCGPPLGLVVESRVDNDAVLLLMHVQPAVARQPDPQDRAPALPLADLFSKLDLHVTSEEPALATQTWSWWLRGSEEGVVLRLPAAAVAGHPTARLCVSATLAPVPAADPAFRLCVASQPLAEELHRRYNLAAAAGVAWEGDSEGRILGAVSQYLDDHGILPLVEASNTDVVRAEDPLLKELSVSMQRSFQCRKDVLDSVGSLLVPTGPFTFSCPAQGSCVVPLPAACTPLVRASVSRRFEAAQSACSETCRAAAPFLQHVEREVATLCKEAAASMKARAAYLRLASCPAAALSDACAVAGDAAQR